LKKQKKYKAKRKNGLVRRSVVWTSQTDYHLLEICAYKGWSEKDIGRAVDYVTTAFQDIRSGHGSKYM